MKIWGYWATLAWAVLAFLAGQFVGFAPAAVAARGRLGTRSCKRRSTASSSRLFIFISNPVTIGVLAARRVAAASAIKPNISRCTGRERAM